MTRSEMLDILNKHLDGHPVSYQAGYLRELIRMAVPDQQLSIIADYILEKDANQIELDFKGTSNAHHC